MSLRARKLATRAGLGNSGFMVCTGALMVVYPDNSKQRENASALSFVRTNKSGLVIKLRL